MNNSTIQLLPDELTTTFTVIDIATGEHIDLDAIMMDDEEVQFTQSSGQVQMSNPYSVQEHSF